MDREANMLSLSIIAYIIYLEFLIIKIPANNTMPNTIHNIVFIILDFFVSSLSFHLSGGESLLLSWLSYLK